VSYPTVSSEFSSRTNCIGFFRWFFAFAVIFSHAGPVAGLYGGKDLGTQISSEQSIGGVAVAGFFFFSGYLITRSRERTGTVRFFWHRVLRIFPAFWLALLVTAFVLAPVAWMKAHGSADGYWGADLDNPLTYFPQNMFLMLDQRNIAGMGAGLPHDQYIFEQLGFHGGGDWNGSAWTLQYEFKAYILVGLLGLVGWLLSRAGWASGRRWVSSALALAVIVLNALLWSGHLSTAGWPGATLFGHPFLADPFNLMFLAPFAFGMLFAAWSDLIPVHWVLAVLGLALAGYTYAEGNWNAFGQYGLLYACMWAAVRWHRLHFWDQKFGDLSYGVYILAWPLMTFATYYGLQDRGAVVYLAVIVVAVHAYALLSWHLIEKPAMSLKDWTPAFLRRDEPAAAGPAPSDPAHPPPPPTPPRPPPTPPG
jgi:peptidoglycan/LPS O-acetylase OafA/YrhL